MIDHLATILDNFPGRANRTRCFAHILNLVAKCIMKQFDAPKKKADDEMDDSDEGVDDLAAVLDELEGELEDENEGVDWEYDMRANMTREDIEALEESVKPVRSVLTKVR
jgi:hypothetical protein